MTPAAEPSRHRAPVLSSRSTRSTQACLGLRRQKIGLPNRNAARSCETSVMDITAQMSGCFSCTPGDGVLLFTEMGAQQGTLTCERRPAMEETLNVGQVNRARKISASPEEGRRLIQAFLRIERPDLREEIFKFVTEMLRAQGEGASQQWAALQG
jgi:hypothetical protein